MSKKALALILIIIAAAVSVAINVLGGGAGDTSGGGPFDGMTGDADPQMESAGMMAMCPSNDADCFVVKVGDLDSQTLTFDSDSGFVCSPVPCGHGMAIGVGTELYVSFGDSIRQPGNTREVQILEPGGEAAVSLQGGSADTCSIQQQIEADGSASLYAKCGPGHFEQWDGSSPIQLEPGRSYLVMVLDVVL